VVAAALRSSIYEPLRGRVRLVYNGVDAPPRIDRAAARGRIEALVGRCIGPDETLFMSLSSPVPFKGLHDLFGAAALARSRGLRARYVCAGVGDNPAYEERLLRTNREIGVDDIVHMVGYVSDPMSLLPGADALVLPSLDQDSTQVDGRTIAVPCNEGLPRSILEAMAAGLPVIASATSGVLEQVEEGVTGWLVPPAEPAVLADRLERVAADPAWRASAGRRALEIVRAKFTVEGAAAGLVQVLAEVATGSTLRRAA